MPSTPFAIIDFVGVEPPFDEEVGHGQRSLTDLALLLFATCQTGAEGDTMETGDPEHPTITLGTVLTTQLTVRVQHGDTPEVIVARVADAVVAYFATVNVELAAADVYVPAFLTTV